MRILILFAFILIPACGGVAALLTIIANSVTRRAARDSRAVVHASPSHFRIEVMHLHKLIIPVLSLGLIRVFYW